VPALTRPIRWERIAEQYDQMIKYATAIRTRTAQTEAILRRFMQANAIHPTYQAMIELGRVAQADQAASRLRRRLGGRPRSEQCLMLDVRAADPRVSGLIARPHSRFQTNVPRRGSLRGF
jgi:hypothetical protein